MADWNLSTVMDGIAAYAVAQGVIVNAYGYPRADPVTPAMLVGYPTHCKFNYTFHGAGTAGATELTFPLWFLVSRVLDKTARDALSGMITGLTGIKDKMDAMTGSGVNYADISDMKIEAVDVAGVTYLAAVFDYDVVVS
jgi:hypothetical protein